MLHIRLTLPGPRRPLSRVRIEAGVLLGLVLVFCIFIYSQQHHGLPPCHGGSELYLVDSQTAWVAGDRGVYSTGDGGRSWTQQDSGTDIRLAIAFQQSPILWADRGLALLRARNGPKVVTVDGKVADRPDYPDRAFAFDGSMRFTDRQNGWTDVHQIQRTVDGGARWRHAGEGQCGRLIAVSAQDVFCTRDSDWLHTRDGGLSWSAETTPGAACSNPSMTRLDSGELWLSCKDERSPYHSLDGGRSWQRAQSPVNVEPVAFSSVNEGWGITNQRPHVAVTHTCDGGKAWKTVTSPLLINTRQIAAVQDGQVWLLGYNCSVTVLEDHGRISRRAEVVPPSWLERFGKWWSKLS